MAEILQKIKIGISRCLLGDRVRYDGGHKLNHYLKDTLGKFVEYLPICPEVDCGLSIPREAMHLAGDAKNPRLVTIKTNIDMTDRMLKWADARLDLIEKENISGFIFKSDSPSSGMRSVRIYGKSGVPSRTGIGIFANAFMKRFPLVPVEDDGRLNDPDLRENFIERVFIYKRWQDALKNGYLMNDLVSFHTSFKLIIMAHSPKALSELGSLTAGNKNIKKEDLFKQYGEILMDAVKNIATVKKNTNVLTHIAGYFKKNLSSSEKAELSGVIENYHKGFVPLIVPITILQHYVRKYDEKYLKNQYYLNPYPVELMLRNHF